MTGTLAMTNERILNPHTVAKVLAMQMERQPVNRRGRAPAPSSVKLVLLQIYRWQDCPVTYQEIARDCGISNRTIYECMSLLRRLGLIEVSRPARCHSGAAYRLNETRLNEFCRNRGKEAA